MTNGRPSEDDGEKPDAEVVSENLLVAEQLVLLLNFFITFGPRIFPSRELIPASAPSPRETLSPRSASFSSLPSKHSASSLSLSASSVPTVPLSLSSGSLHQHSQGYGSFASAAIPLYRTLPVVDIPAYFQLFYEIIHNSALFRNFVEWGTSFSSLLAFVDVDLLLSLLHSGSKECNSNA